MLKQGLEFLVGKLSIGDKSLVDGLAYLTHGDAMVVDLEKYRDAPLRVREYKDLPNIAGFAAYLKDFGTENTRLFAYDNNLQVQAVIDYHKSSSDPSWCDHKAEIEFTKDKDFNKWLDMDNRVLSQRELVNFLLDYADDFITPDKASVLEIVGNIKATKAADLDSTVGNYDINQVVKNSVNVQSKAGQLPDVFEVAVPVLEGFDKYKLQFRLAVQISDSGLGFKIGLVRPHNIERQAFNDACDDIVKQSGYSIYGFNPEKVTEVQEA